MRIAVTIEGQEGVTWDEWVQLARTCEAHAFDGLFRSDHYSSVFAKERDSLDPWATLTALASMTRRLRLGTMVSPLTFYHPSQLARLVVTADHVSNGRVELGVGVGWFAEEHTAFGFPFPDARVRLARAYEELEIITRLWTEDVIDYEGRFYTLENCRALPKPVQKPHPPIIVGGGARPGTAALAARYAGEYNTTGASPEACRMRQKRLNQACRDIGRDPRTLRLSVTSWFVVGADRAEARERLKVLSDRMGVTRAELLLKERADCLIVGTVEEVIERLRAYGQAGVGRVFLQNMLHDDVAMLELAGNQILPEVAGLNEEES